MTKYIIALLLSCFGLSVRAQQNNSLAPVKGNEGTSSEGAGIIEIRSYTLKPGTRDAFHQVVIERSLPMLQRWKIDVLGHGPSLQDDSSYYLIRAYKSLKSRQQSEDSFYGSDEWKKGPREAIVSKIVYYTTVIFPADSIIHLSEKIKAMTYGDTHATDSAELSALNRQFIENFINQDATRHNEIIHKDFVCIQGDGSVVTREEYMMGWAKGYHHSGYTSFSYTDELIRLFGNTALVRSKTVYTKNLDGKPTPGNSIYTDTYLKENGKWQCVQAQITPVKAH